MVLANGQEVKTNTCVCTEFTIEAEETSGPEKILFCAKCGAQHIDQGWYADHPHSLHSCQHCGHRWTTPEKTIGVGQYPLTDTKFQTVYFNILEISCPIILGMHFLYDFSISIHPRCKTLTLTSVEGNALQIITEAKRKYPTGEQEPELSPTPDFLLEPPPYSPSEDLFSA